MKKPFFITSLLICATVLCSCDTEIEQNPKDKESPTKAVTTSTETSETTTETQTKNTTTTISTQKDTARTTEKTTVSTAVNIDYMSVYKDILYNCNSLLNGGLNDFSYTDGYMGVVEIAMHDDNAVNEIGYKIEDISGDGISELIIATNYDKNDILAVYTCVDGKPYLTFEGATRNHYYRLNDNSFYFSGSAGAIYSIIGDFNISKDGRNLVCNDYYFTHEKNGNYEDVATYHNKTGEFDVNVSKETDIKTEEFSKLGDKFKGKIMSFSVTPFSDYDSDGQKPEIKTQPVTISADFAPNYSAIDYTDNEESEYQSVIMFKAKGKANNFKFLSISVSDINDDGSLIYDEKVLYSVDGFSENKPIVISMTFIGDLPNYAVSYEDEKGNTHKYTVSLSGQDGSVVLSELK